MKQSFFKVFVVAFTLSSGLTFTSCKGKAKEVPTETNTTTTTPETSTAPVEISNDNALSAGIKDATKDYPGVTATANNGEITLTGNIERSRLPNLMQSLNSLKPKKINNNLNIK